MEEILERRRSDAAEASGGISSEPIYAAVLGRLVADSASGDVLDFGAGAGQFARILLETRRFARIDAVDMVNYGGKKSNGVRWIFSDINARLPAEPESYDVVVSVEVIEHLENPRFVAREWFRLLRPNGRLIFSTPNNESWRSIVSFVVRGHFAAFTGASYPAHITALLQQDMIRILTEAGFRDISFSYTNDGGLPGKPAITWQQVSCGLLKGRRYSDNVVCAATKAADK